MRDRRLIDRSNDIPNSNKLDPYVGGEGSLELHAELETLFVIPRIHGIGEGQLFEIAWREKADLLKHPSEGASCESTARETKNTYLIPHMI